MRAIAFDDFGAPPALADVAQPKPEAGEVLIRVRASSLNGFDLAVLGGMFRGMMEYQFPVVLGKDYAGVVEDVGEGVTGLARGDAVFGVVAKPNLSEGGLAEYVVANPRFGLAQIPAGVDFTQAGALGLAGTAALNVVEAVAPAAGETVLIVGATGGVGAYATQLAVQRGARVIATARPGAEAEFVRGLGASDVVDYSADIAAQVRAVAPDGVSAAIHLAGDGASVAALLAPGGRLTSTLGFGPDQAARSDITVIPVMADPNPATLKRLADMVAGGTLRVPINQSYPLAEVPQAIGSFGAGTIGKLSVVVD